MSKIVAYLESLDIFGQPIGVNFRGEDTYKTKMGAFCTLSYYVLVLVNIVTLSTAFSNHSNMDTSTQQ